MTAAPAGIAAIATPSATSVLIQFTEPVDPTTAQLVANYSVSGVTVTAAHLQTDGYTVTLTTAVLGTGSHTLTISNVKTLALAALPTLTSTFTYMSAGWTATLYMGNISQSNLTNAQSVVSTPGYQISSTTFYPATINFRAGSSTSLGDYANETLMPNQTSQTTEWDNYVIAASGNLYIPTAGNYTFDVPSDDGFGLTITGATFTTLTNATNSTGSNAMQYNAAAERPIRWAWPRFPTAGYYPISLLYFQGGGPSSVEVSAAAGSYTAWNSTNFHLVGDTANGGLGLGGTYNAAHLHRRRQRQVDGQHLARLDRHGQRSGRVGDRAGQRQLLCRRQQRRRHLVAAARRHLRRPGQRHLQRCRHRGQHVWDRGLRLDGQPVGRGHDRAHREHYRARVADVRRVNSIAITFSEPVENFTLAGPAVDARQRRPGRQPAPGGRDPHHAPTTRTGRSATSPA